MRTGGRPIRHVVLLGLMGSGKTTVGRLVATRLARPFLDSDAAIEASEGRSARAIRERSGTDALRRLEARHLLTSLASPVESVIAAAASTIEDAACHDALMGGPSIIVWLTASPRTGAGRFDAQPHRPRYGEDTAAFLARQAIERAPLFRSLDPVELATDARTPEDLAATICSLVTVGQ